VLRLAPIPFLLPSADTVESLAPHFPLCEREANFFAASLLMPRQFLKQDLEGEDYVNLLDDDFLTDLSRKYGVSTQALVNRLKNLGYIPD
jgi:Zn-dependent peptidase ImmA (M78 family)